MREPAIVLYDGECSFCDATVQFILERDPKGQFRFAPLQSEVARELLRRGGLDPDQIDTVVLIEDQKIYTKSTAALRIARRLRGLTPALYPLIAAPRRLRDAAYEFFSARRYRWFPRMEQCRTPAPEERDRFLDEESWSPGLSPYEPS